MKTSEGVAKMKVAIREVIEVREAIDRIEAPKLWAELDRLVGELHVVKAGLQLMRGLED